MSEPSTDLIGREQPLTFDIDPADPDARRRAAERLDSLAKPPGSLGRLEELGRRIAAAQHRVPPTADRVRSIVFAASHGVAARHSVSAYPSDVTRRMLETYARGRGAVNVLTDRPGIDLEVVDLGVAGADAPIDASASHTEVRHDRVRPEGTADLVREPAMRREEWRRARRVGIEAVDRSVDGGAEVLALGEMGIGNTTASAASAARLLGADVAAVPGRGSGVDDERLEVKREAVVSALRRSDVPPQRPFAVLGDLGGLELVALAGAMLRAAERNRPVLLDGFITGVAALAAVRVDDDCRGYILLASRSDVRGHDRVLEALRAGEPLLDWGMRLGEASAAALAVPLVRSACDLFDDMATLDDVFDGSPST